MPPSTFLRRGALALVLLSSLAAVPPAPLAAAPAGPYRQQVVRPHPGLFGSFWRLMTSLWGREGATTDPTGHH
jgi:hypothetical protein